MAPPQSTPLRVAFLHPDLGLGGAERLVVDAAAELALRGHTIHMYTSHYDPHRCFDETKSGLFTVTVAGAWLPRAVLGRLHLLCALLRCAVAALTIAWRVYAGVCIPYDVVFVDQVAAVLPLLRLLLPRTRQLFYCHFPDLLLAPRGAGAPLPLRLARAAYRAPFDWAEEAATGSADLLLVNSRFTAAVFADTFRHLAARGVAPGVLYPAVSLPEAGALEAAAVGWARELDPRLVALLRGGPTFLSINRFERKKGIGLAVAALAELLAGQPRCGARLVLAGGYDVRVAENREHLEELRGQVADLGLQERVAFVPSFTDRQRELLLAAARAVVYTPVNEHFGIVPIEAMAAARPVVACNSGGPKESVLDGRTGLLCDPTPAAFAAAMAQLLDERRARDMGEAARSHVRESFSRTAFGDQLNEDVLRMLHGGAR